MRKTCITWLSIMLILFPMLGVNALAQGITVAGKVTDASDGNPIPGVNVVVKGTTNGTVTDLSGSYTISAEQGSTLVYSFVGFTTREIPVAGQSVIDVQLAPDVTELSEIVVVGYGQQQKGDVTGVVQKVDAETFNRGAIVNADQLINGKVAGVQITSNSGEPGGQTYIRIRGGTSINASNEPLYVIDGVPVDNSAHDPGPMQGGRNPLNLINPNDIESFTVLKDASATAIYGSRGANGVIIITTKKGNTGAQSKVTYDAWTSVANPVNTVEVFDAQGFRKLVSEKAPGRVNMLGNANTNWQDELLQQAIGQSHNLSLSGGSKNVGYRASVGYLDQDGVVKGSNTKRTSLALNYNHSLLNDNLKIDANFKGAHTRDLITPNGVLGNAIRMAPTQPIRDANSPWGGYFEWENDLATKNPVAELELTQDEGNNYRSIGNIQFDYSLPFIEGLSAKLNLGYDVFTGERTRFLPSNLRSQYSDNGEIRRANFTRTNTLMDAYLNYKTDFEGIRSSIDFTGGYSYQDFSNKYPEIRAWDLSSNLLGYNSSAPARFNSSSISVLENRLISFFGRVNYSLMDKYLVTFTLRRDGSSRFGTSNRWGTFPSAAVAWRMIDEPWMQGLNNVVSDLKLRAGWGITGNQEIGDYRFLPTYTFGDNLAQYQFGDDYITTIRPNGVDPNLKWEETQSYNLGLDYELLDGRLSGSFEYYYKKTSDLLSEVTVAAGSNLTNIILTNIGQVENQGFEATINANLISNEKFSWNLGFNVATNKNKVAKLTNFEDPSFVGIPTGGIGGGTGNKVQILRVGYPVNAFHVFRHKKGDDGKPLVDIVDHNDDGSIDLEDMYEDTNNDGAVNDLDRVPYEQPAPDVILGLTNQMYFRNFDLNFTLRGNIGNYVYNNVASNNANLNKVITEIVPMNMPVSVLDYNFTNPQYFSDVYVENASFLRMDNLTLGYTLPEFGNNMNLRVYGTVQNLFVLTDYTGLDPEIGNAGGKASDRRFGIDENIFPRSRTFMLGLSFGF